MYGADLLDRNISQGIKLMESMEDRRREKLPPPPPPKQGRVVIKCYGADLLDRNISQ